MRNPVSGLMEAIVAGDAVDTRFAANATVNSPLRGEQRLSDWAGDEHDWLIESATTVRPISHIVTDSHASAEYVLAMARDGTDVELPLHVVAELKGDRITALRMYHSTYPLTG